MPIQVGAPSQTLWNPVLGQKSVTWDQVFKLIERPEMLWSCWQPLKTLDKMTMDEQWICYDSGEPVFNADGIQTGIKPPLRKVELYFASRWRRDNKVGSIYLFQ